MNEILDGMDAVIHDYIPSLLLLLILRRLSVDFGNHTKILSMTCKILLVILKTIGNYRSILSCFVTPNRGTLRANFKSMPRNINLKLREFCL